MAQPNTISVVLDDATLTEVRKAISTLRTKLVPLLTTLTPQDRQELPKIGERTTEFVRKAYEYTGVHPDLVPSYVSPAQFKTDLDAMAVLQNLEFELAPVTTAVADSLLLAGSEAYQAALLFYNSVKLSKKTNLGSSGLVYEDLASRFPGASPKRA